MRALSTPSLRLRALRAWRTMALAGVALLILLACLRVVRYYQLQTPTPTVRRTSDFLVTWRCLECAATHEDRAGRGPHACRGCGKQRAYVSIQHACPEHGPRTIFFQYDAAGDPEQVALEPGKWQAPGDAEGNSTLRCPQCESYLLPAERPKTAPSG